MALECLLTLAASAAAAAAAAANAHLALEGLGSLIDVLGIILSKRLQQLRHVKAVGVVSKEVEQYCSFLLLPLNFGICMPQVHDLTRPPAMTCTTVTATAAARVASGKQH